MQEIDLTVPLFRRSHRMWETEVQVPASMNISLFMESRAAAVGRSETQQCLWSWGTYRACWRGQTGSHPQVSHIPGGCPSHGWLTCSVTSEETFRSCPCPTSKIPKPLCSTNYSSSGILQLFRPLFFSVNVLLCCTNISNAN